jgi:hypothetical protein
MSKFNYDENLKQLEINIIQSNETIQQLKNNLYILRGNIKKYNVDEIDDKFVIDKFIYSNLSIDEKKDVLYKIFVYEYLEIKIKYQLNLSRIEQNNINKNIETEYVKEIISKYSNL